MGDPAHQFVRTAAPLYRDVAAALERRIRSGDWKPGDQIPTEAQLEREFGSSRGTLRTAIAELVRRGLLHPQPGRGTFVLGPSFRSFERFFRYESRGSDARLSPQNQVLRHGVRKAGSLAANVLGVPPGADVGYVRRLRIHEGEPFLLIDSYFHLDEWQRIKTADFQRHSLYDQLRDDFGIYIIAADEYLRADLAAAAEARLLNIPARSAVIRIERTACTFGGRAVEYRNAVGRADRFQYHVRLE
jgi:GntR family transcriptional regulator